METFEVLELITLYTSFSLQKIIFLHFQKYNHFFAFPKICGYTLKKNVIQKKLEIKKNFFLISISIKKKLFFN